MFTDRCLLPGQNPLSDKRTEPGSCHSSPKGAERAHSPPVPGLQQPLHQPLCLGFFVSSIPPPIFLAWFCTFLPWGPQYLDFIAKNESIRTFSPFFPFLLPTSLLVLVSSEDLTITSVLQKCLNVFPRPLCIFFFPENLDKQKTKRICTAAPVFRHSVWEHFSCWCSHVTSVPAR